MRVRSGAKIAGTARLIEVELEDSDMQDVESWSDQPISQKFTLMTKRADMLLVTYMMRDGDISQEYAAQRIKEIKER